MFDLALSGNACVAQIARIVRDEWQYKTPQRKSTGGKTPSISAIYKLLSNPFYCGLIRWKSELLPGIHKPIVTKVEFERVQALIHGTQPARPKTNRLRYAGFIRCGACGLAITAERKTKPSGRTYTYYHCTRVHRTPRCTEKSIEERKLEEEIMSFLEAISLPDSMLSAYLACLPYLNDQKASQVQIQAQNTQDQINKLDRQRENLTDLRLKDLMEDEEYLARRSKIDQERFKLEEIANKSESDQSMFEPAAILIYLCSRAKLWFPKATDEQKRTMLKILCSNPVLMDQKPLLKAKKPFLRLAENTAFL